MRWNIFLLVAVVFWCFACKKVNNDCNQNTYENAPDKEWIKSHDGSKEESHGHFIMTCSDGGFLQIGETGFITSSSYLLVIKTNSNGDGMHVSQLLDLAEQVGVDRQDFADCQKNNRDTIVASIEKKMAQGAQAGVKGTPGVFSAS